MDKSERPSFSEKERQQERHEERKKERQKKEICE